METQNPEETKPSSVDNAEEINTEETQASATTGAENDEAGDEDIKKKKGRRAWLRAIGLGTVAFIMILGMALYGGYKSGERDQQATQNVVDAVEAVIQDSMAREELAEGRCALAEQRTDWIRQYVPAYPPLVDLLVAVDICKRAAPPTPTGIPPMVSPTAMVTPTEDSRNVEEIYADVVAYKAAEDWDLLIETLYNLRANYPDYKTVEVDNLYYFAFRSRGAQRILLEGNLESGIFDLNLAERFGALDVEAQSYRQWAEWYITGLSFWEVNWGESVNYFSQVVISAPNISDSNYFTAANRLATAQVSYAYELIARSEYLLTVKGWCAADRNYKTAFSYIGMNPEIQPTAEWATLKCQLNPDEGPDN